MATVSDTGATIACCTMLTKTLAPSTRAAQIRWPDTSCAMSSRMVSSLRAGASGANSPTTTPRPKAAIPIAAASPKPTCLMRSGISPNASIISTAAATAAGAVNAMRSSVNSANSDLEKRVSSRRGVSARRSNQRRNKTAKVEKATSVNSAAVIVHSFAEARA